MADMEKRITIDGRPEWHWNLEYGKSYWLGYHHGHVAGIGMAGVESVYGMYIGTVDDNRIFVRQKGNEFLLYEGDANSPAGWYSDGDDDVSMPAVNTRFAGLLKAGHERQYVSDIFARRQKSANAA